MRKIFLLAFIIFVGCFQIAKAQTAGCQIELGITPPVVCVGTTLCVSYTATPTSCVTPSCMRIELSSRLPNPTAPCDFSTPLSNAGNCLNIPLTLRRGKYCVRIRCGTVVSNAKTIDIDTVDNSPSPRVVISQVPPIRPVYCPDDTITYRIDSLVNAGTGYTILWSKNDTAKLEAIDSVFSVTGLLDGDFISVVVTKQSKCAQFAAGRSNSIPIKVVKKPKVRLVLAPGSSGCENTPISFIAKPDTAGPNPTYIWTREYGGTIDTLSQGINDSLFTLTPADSAKVGSRICVELIDGRCKFTDKDCFNIKACGQVEIDPPLDTAACAGTIYRVPYVTIGSFLTGNVFSLQMSDSLGDFSNPTPMGTLVSNKADTINTLIPAIITGGNCYKFRIISSQPADTSNVSDCIKIFARPQPPVAIHDTVCQSGIVDLSVTSTLVSPTFVWYATPFSTTPVFTGNVLSLNITRDTVFYVAQLSPLGCPGDRVAVRGVILPEPDAEAGPNRKVCVGDAPINLTPFPSTGTWSGPFLITGNVLDFTGQAPGLYTFKYSVSNAFGCIGVDSFTLTINQIPVVNAGPDSTICSNNQSILLTGTPAGGSWSGPSGIQSDGTFVPASSGAGIFNAIYTVIKDGCTGRDTAVITVNQAPPIFTIATIDPSACNIDDGSATLQGITTGPGFKVKWSVDRADSLSDPTITNLGAGAYTVVVSDSSTGCRRFGAFGLSDPTAPTPVISGLAANYCSSDACVTMGVSPISPSGSFTGTGVSGNQFCPQLANLGPNIVVYSYDTTGGCTGTTSLVVRVNESPVVNVGPLSSDTICRNDGTYTISGFSPPAPPAVWSPSSLISNSGVVNLALAAAGTNELVISRTLAACTATDTFRLVVNENPVVAISRQPTTTVCQGVPVKLTANISNGVTGNFFEWFKDGVIIPNQNQDSILVTEAGSYTVKASTTSSCEGNSTPIVVSFNDLPSNGVNPSGILQPCSNNPVTLTADSLAGYTFQWFGTDSISGATQRTYVPTASGQYRVRIRNASNCSVFSSVIDVNILPAPLAPVVTPPLSDTCLQAGQPISITIGATGLGLTFNWFKIGTPNQPQPATGPTLVVSSPGSYFAEVVAANGCKALSDTVNVNSTILITATDTVFNICQGVNTQITGLSPTTNCVLLYNGSPVPSNIFGSATPGEYILTYVCTNSNGCVSRKNIKVVVGPSPSAFLIAQGASDVCQGDTVRLLVNDGLGTGEFYELFRNGSPVGGVFTNPLIKVTSAGTYTVRVTKSGCSKISNQRIVNIKKIPLADAGPDLSSCSPLTVNLNTGLPTPGNWSGSPRVVTSGNYASGSFIGTDTVTLTVDSSNGCSNTDRKVIEIKANPNFSTAVSPASACLTNDGKAWVVGSAGLNLNYRWFKVGQVDTLSTTDTLANVLPGAYSVKVFNPVTGCSSVFIAIINSPNNLDVQVAGLPDSLCANASPVLLTGIPAASGVFTSFFNRIVGSPQSFDPSLPGGAIDTVYYTATVNGCVGTGKKVVKINAIPVVDAGPNQSVCFGDTIVLQAVQPTGVSLIWVGNQVENDSLYIASDPGITSSLVSVGYTLNGCSNTDTKTITVNSLPQYTLDINDVTQCGVANGSATRNILNPASFQTTWRNVQSGLILGTGAQITNLAVGIYSIEITNNTTGCTDFQSFGITGPTNINPFVCLQNVPSAICQNQPPVAIGRCSPSASIFIDGVQTDTLKPSIYIPGNIGVILTDTDANGCIGVEQKIVDIRAVPNVNVAGTGPDFACTSQTSVQLTGFSPAFDGSVPENGWTAAGAPAGFITKSGLINPSLITSDQVITLTYTSKVPGPNGCTESKDFTFRVYKNPDAVILPNTTPVTICQGASTLFTSQANTLGLTYTWFRNNQPIGFDDSLSATLQGIYTLQVSNNGCNSGLSNQISLITNPAPVIANIGPDSTICQGAGVFQIPAPSVVGTFTSASWQAVGSTPAAFVSAGGVINPASGLPGNNQVRFIVTNGTCSDTATRNFFVSENINSNISILGDTVLCANDRVKLVAGSSGPGLGYEWSRNGIAIPGSDNDTLTVLQAGIYRVRIIINGNGVCALPSTRAVTVIQAQTPQIANLPADSTICQGAPVFQLPTPSISGPFTSTSWQSAGSTPAAFVSAGGVVNAAAGTLGTNVVRFIATNFTCADTASRNLIVSQNINSPISILGDTVLCPGDVIKLISGTTGAGIGYEWSRNGVPISNSDNDTLNVSEAGTYRVKIIINGNGFCALPSTRIVTVIQGQAPVVNITGGDTLKVCYPGESINLNQVRPYTPADALWSGPGSLVTSNGVLSPANLTSEGTYPLILTKILGTCVAADTLWLKGYAIPNPVFQATANDVCEGDSVTYTYVNPNSYRTIWLRNNTDTLRPNNPNVLTTDTGATYTLIVQNNLCSASASRTLVINPNPVFTMPAPFDTCKNTGLIQLKLTNNNSVGVWSGPGITDANLGNWNSNDNSVPASGEVMIIYNGSLGNCSRKDTVMIQVDPVPPANIIVDKPVIEIFGPAVLSVQTLPGSSILWSPASTLSSNSGTTVSAKPEETTRYFVEITSAKGCKNNGDTLIRVDRDFEIFDGFSPNNDGNNDFWNIKNIQQYPEAMVRVYNRWGNLVYESGKGYPVPWDGKYKGDEVPPGAYFYIIDLGGGLKPKSGSLTLVR